MQIDPNSIDAAAAALIANRFLERGGAECGMPGPTRPTLLGPHYQYLTGTDEPIFEFPLVSQGHASGFVLVSGTQALPPILAFCGTGNSFRELLDDAFNGLVLVRSIQVKARTWRYFGPMDFVAEVPLPSGRILYARVPNFHIVEVDQRISALTPKADKSTGWNEERWSYYVNPLPKPIPTAWGKLLDDGPVRYNQTCQSSLSEQDVSAATHGPNYCTPHCISGCVATAWTVLASAWKKFAYVETDIFADAPDWDRDWQSSYGGPPPPGSAVVNRRMWAVHSYMQTTCEGESTDFRTFAGSRLFQDYGKPWQWHGQFDGVNYAFAASINKSWQPFLLTAQNTWIPGGERVGHGVVVYGWNDNEQHLLVCFGWGSSFPDMWIAFGTMSDVGTYYIVQLSEDKPATRSPSGTVLPAIYSRQP